MRRFLFCSIVLLLMVGSSALGQDVRYNFDKDTDFSKFKTYKWVEIKGAQQVDPLIDKQIKSALEAELAKKGLSRVETDNADLLIGYQTAIGQEKQFNSYNTGWGYGPGWGGGWYGGGGMSTTTTSTTTIYTGQLDVDMYDSAHHDLVWRGVASKAIDTKAKPDKVEKNLAKAAQKLFKNYPPPVKK
jgi:Domain of unknown function (DUF4136)